MKNICLRNLVGVLLFYAFIVFGVVIINARMETINEASKVVSLGN